MEGKYFSFIREDYLKDFLKKTMPLISGSKLICETQKICF